MKNYNDFLGAFSDYNDFHDSVFNHIVESGHDFFSSFILDGDGDFVIKCAEHAVAFYIEGNFVKASPFISDAPCDELIDQQVVMQVVSLKRPTLLPFSVISGDEFTDYSELSEFYPSEDIVNKIAQLSAVSLNEVFSEISDDLFMPAAVQGIRFAHRLIEAGFDEEEILELDDAPIAALSKVMLESVLGNNRLQEL